MQGIRSSLQCFVKKGELTQEAANDAVANVKHTTLLKEMSFADVIIEAIIENENVKKSEAFLSWIAL